MKGTVIIIVILFILFLFLGWAGIDEITSWNTKIIMNDVNITTNQTLINKTLLPLLPKSEILPPITCAIDPNITQENINTTICVSGYTATIRPPTSYTNKIKKELLYGYQAKGMYLDKNLSDFQLDHCASLCLGGDPTNKYNLWLEPLFTTPNARDKDKVENWLHRQVCNGNMTLIEAQTGEITNWVKYINVAGGGITEVTEWHDTES